MLKGLKKLFTIEEIVSIMIRSIGYGYGYMIPDALGCNTIISIIICFVIGFIFSKAVELFFKNNKKPTLKNRIIILISAYLVYLLFWFASYYIFKHDLDKEMLYDVLISVGLYFAGAIINTIKKSFTKKKKLDKKGDSMDDKDLEKVTGGTSTQEKSPIESYYANGVTNRATNLIYYGTKNYIYGEDVQAGMNVSISGKCIIWGSDYYCITVAGQERFIAAYCVDIK